MFCRTHSARSIDLLGNPVYSVSCERACGLTPWPPLHQRWRGGKGDCSIRFEDTAIERLSMSSPKTTNLEQAKKFRSMRGGEMSSTGHEPVYHAAHSCQAASLSLTTVRLRGLFWACQVEGQKNAGFLALVDCDQYELGLLGRWACMLLLCVLKGGRLIAAMMQPHGKDDPDPHIGKRSDRYRMAFAASRSLALVILHGPRLALGRLPGKLMQDVAQGFDTTQ